MSEWSLDYRWGIGCATVGSLLSHRVCFLLWKGDCHGNNGVTSHSEERKGVVTVCKCKLKKLLDDWQLILASTLLLCFDFTALVFAPLALVLPNTMFFIVWDTFRRLLYMKQQSKATSHKPAAVENKRQNYVSSLGENVPDIRVDIGTTEAGNVREPVKALCEVCSVYERQSPFRGQGRQFEIFVVLALWGIFSGPTDTDILGVDEVVQTDVRSLLYGSFFIVIAILLYLFQRHIRGTTPESNGMRINAVPIPSYVGAVLSGLFGGQSVTCLKLVAEVVKTLIVTERGVFNKAATYVLGVLVILFAGVHLVTLRNILRSVRGSYHRFYLALYGYKLGFFVSAGLGSIVFLQELKSISSPLQLTLYIVFFCLTTIYLALQGYLKTQKRCACTPPSAPARQSCLEREQQQAIEIPEDSQQGVSAGAGTCGDSETAAPPRATSPSSLGAESRSPLLEISQPVTWHEKLVHGDHSFPQPWWTMVPRDVLQGGTGYRATTPEGGGNDKCYWRDPGDEADQWNVRGSNYMTDKVKVDAGPSRMAVAAMEWSQNPDNPVRNIAGVPDGYLQTVLQNSATERPFVFVVNFMVPSLGNFVTYYVRKRHVPDPVFDETLLRFVEEDDAYRNARFKLIPGVKQGGFFVKRAVGRKPALVCSKLDASYHRGDRYFEVCIDVGSSRIGASIMGAVKGYASGLVLHMGFLIEGSTPQELPERILGGIDIHNPVMQPAPGHPLTPPSEWKAHFHPSGRPRPSAHLRPPAPESESETGSDSSVSSTGYESPIDSLPSRSPTARCRSSNPSAPLNYGYVPPPSMVRPRGEPNPHAPEGCSSWADAGGAGNFKVRGGRYLEDRVKVPSAESYLEPLALEWTYRPDQPVLHAGEVPGGLVQEQHVRADRRPFLLVVNFAVPTVGNFVTYFARRRGAPPDPAMDEALQAFIDGDDEYRNARFKLIPSVLQGSYIVRKAVGTKPALLCSKLRTSYFAGENYFEICIDVGSSRIGAGIMGTVKGFATSLELRLGFLIEGKTKQELPERMLGGVDIFKPVMKPAPGVATNRGSVDSGVRRVNTTAGVTHRSQSMNTQVANV